MIGIRGTAFKLAVFTVFTALITVWLASVIGNFRLFSNPYEIKAEFSDATGLLVGDAVKAAGVTVGRVSDIRVRDGIAVVSMQIDDGTELPSGLSAEIRFRNLIGQRMVVFTTDGISAEASRVGTGTAAAGEVAVTEPGDLIPLARTEPAFDLTVLFNGLRPLIQSTNPDDINLVTAELIAALEGKSGDIEALLANVADLSDVLASRDQELQVLLDNVNVITTDLAGRDEQLRRTFANLDLFLTDLAASRADLDNALVTLDEATNLLRDVVATNDEDLQAELADLSVILEAVDARRKDLRGAIRSLPEVVVGLERTSNYGQWGNIHLIHVCKDDFGTCGTRWTP